MKDSSEEMAEISRVIEKFDGEDFHIWKFKMQMILEEKDLWEVVEGPDLSTAEVALQDTWNRRARKALATICLHLKDGQLIHVRSCTSAKEAWKKLSELYETRSLSTRLFLRRKFFSI